MKRKNKEKHFEITENKNKPSVDNCNLKLITQKLPIKIEPLPQKKDAVWWWLAGWFIR